jgi:ssDNA thymidine ADP-ribosyltransferase, DarT
MTTPPANPKIYHITHVDNLGKIIDDGCLWSDRAWLERSLNCSIIGMPAIKQRRLNRIAVSCHPRTTVGDYVPFYFCPRSVMLYIFHRNNHADLPYRGGQTPIVHLQADMNDCVDWANRNSVRFSFSNRNAGSRTTDFYSDLAELNRINWEAVNSRNFRDRQMQEEKQAEFLVFGHFPWTLVEHIGVIDQHANAIVTRKISQCSHQPTVRVENGWYF